MDCSICFTDLASEFCQISECNHRFCKSCIQKWSEQHNTCPLCNTLYESVQLVINDDIQELIFDKKPAEVEDNYDCLDHQYFRQEINRLLDKIDRIYQEKFKRRNSNGTPEEHQALIWVQQQVEYLQQQNQSLDLFDPKQLLEDLEYYNNSTQKIEQGLVPGEIREAIESERYDDYSSNDDDFYY